MKILDVVGARPTFMKVAPVHAALADVGTVTQWLIHTGQHYEIGMSEVFFTELGLPQPEVSLKVASGSHAVQTALVMVRLEAVLLERRPDLALVYGDVNSTRAAALVCAKLAVPVGHVEVGLRSFDRSMPEEVNRVLTDQLADLLFTPSADANTNLLHEGLPQQPIHLVGKVMIETLVGLLPLARTRWPRLRDDLWLTRYVLATLHRPSNVDAPDVMGRVLAGRSKVSSISPLWDGQAGRRVAAVVTGNCVPVAES